MFLFFQVPNIEPVAKNLPAIIKAASQSERGIFALLIIVLFGLALYFFRKAAVKWRALVFFAFFGGVFAYGWEISRVVSKPGSTHYTGHIVDRVTSAPLHDALVTVSLGRTSFPPYHSDSEGSFSFWLERKKASDDANVRIEHDNYREYDRTVSSDQTALLGEIRLEPLTAAAEPPAPPPATPGAAGDAGSNAAERVKASRPPASNVGLEAGRVAASTLPNEIHPSMANRPAAKQEMSAIARTLRSTVTSSGQKLSGRGKDWSPWYEVRVGAAPNGYTIQSVDFWLTGDRTCGAWAECKEVVKNDSKVIWSFRLQGHDEWGAPPQAYSEGHLRVIFVSK